MTALVLSAAALFGVLAYLAGWRRGYFEAISERHERLSASARFGARTRANNRLDRTLARLVTAIADAPPHDDGAAPIQTTITNGAEGPE